MDDDPPGAFAASDCEFIYSYSVCACAAEREPNNPNTYIKHIFTTGIDLPNVQPTVTYLNNES